MRKAIPAGVAVGVSLGTLTACGLVPMAGAGGLVPMDSTKAVAVAEQNVCGRAMAPGDTACVVTGYSHDNGEYLVHLDRHPPAGNDHLVVALTQNGQHVEVNQESSDLEVQPVNHPRFAQGSPCLTNVDTAATHIEQVKMALTGGDSARLVQQGLPYRPTGISLVTDSATCAAVVNAYNSTSHDSTTMVTRAYVLRVGSTNYVAVGENRPSVYVYFDSTYRWLAGLVSMQ